MELHKPNPIDKTPVLFIERDGKLEELRGDDAIDDTGYFICDGCYYANWDGRECLVCNRGDCECPNKRNKTKEQVEEMKCAECGKEIAQCSEYLEVADNHLQATYFDTRDDAIFCCEECLLKALTVERKTNNRK